jgi:DNA methylase
MTVAIEDAGFEIRDQIMYLYGSGFPKSLDVSKAIDKVKGEPDRLLKFVKWMKTTGLKAAQINQAIEKSDVGSHYLRLDQPAIPTAELWEKLRPLIADVPDWVDELVARIEAEREVVGRGQSTLIAKSGTYAITNGEAGEKWEAKEYDITAPATPEAQRWQGWGTALKPAHEPICVARKPLVGTVANNVLTYGTGALNIDGSRVASELPESRKRHGGGSSDIFPERGNEATMPSGRWPANVIHDGSDEVLAGFPTTSTWKAKNPKIYETDSMFGAGGINFGKADSGSAARFFYCAKASKSERNAGLEGLPEKRESDREKDDGVGGDNPRNQTNAPRQNFHPTVKPLALMRYLVKLVTPPGGTVLDPFLGSGSTAVAATLEGFEWIGCEMTEDYFPIIEARVAWAEAQPQELRPTV